MILVLLQWGKDALSSLVKKDYNCWSEQSPKKSTVPCFGGHPVLHYGAATHLAPWLKVVWHMLQNIVGGLEKK